MCKCECLKKVTFDHVILAVLLVVVAMLMVQNYRISKMMTYFFLEKKSYTYHDAGIFRDYDRLIRDFEEINELNRRFLGRQLAEDRRRSYFAGKERDDDFDQRSYRAEKTGGDGHSKVNEVKNFVYSPKVSVSEKEFTVKVRVPVTFTSEDVKVDLTNGNLVIRAEKQKEGSDKNSRSVSYSSFFESFELPDTKATVKDVKVNLENKNRGSSELTVVVPILK
jgi:HSP20 family molecular chaperone IbpA